MNHSTRDLKLALDELDSLLSGEKRIRHNDPYLLAHGARWRMAVSSDRLNIMQELDARGELEGSHKAELDTARAILASLTEGK